LTPCTKSVAASDGRWFSVRIMPYRTLANAVNGAVLTFVDISTAKALELSLRESQLPASTTKDAP
jgi:two-component system CheB/CheR fusion protein